MNISLPYPYPTFSNFVVSPYPYRIVPRSVSVLPRATTTISEAPDFAVGPSSNLDAVRHDKRSRKRTVSDMLNLIPSLQCLELQSEFSKRRKIMDSRFSRQTSPQALISSEMIGKTEGYSYASLIDEANKGNAPSSIYVLALLHVVRHCSLCIKHARLSSQMDALDIPYVEKVGLRNASSNLWFRLPLARGDTWQHICLQLGRPGSMYWDVKINDQHFRTCGNFRREAIVLHGVLVFV